MKVITPEYPKDIKEFVFNFNVTLGESNYPFYLRLGAALVSAKQDIDYEVDILKHNDTKFFKIMWYSEKDKLSKFTSELGDTLKSLR